MPAWWGDVEAPENQWCHWRIGALSLFAHCNQSEWHFAWKRGDDPLELTLTREFGITADPDLDDTEQARFVFTGEHHRLTLQPKLADRPVIARPEFPVFVPPGQRVILYVSTALWLQLSAAASPLIEIPITRPSDTWFGANTRLGELCYASLTRARTSDAGHPPFPHRATTPVDITNEGATPLQIQQIRVPVPALALYASDAGHIVTDAVHLHRLADEDHATLEISSDGERQAVERIAEPREASEPGTVVQAFTKFFS